MPLQTAGQVYSVDLQIKDTWSSHTVLCPLFGGYNHNTGAEKGVHNWEVVHCSEGPLSEVPL